MGNFRKKIKIFLPSLVNIKWWQPWELAKVQKVSKNSDFFKKNIVFAVQFISS